MSDEGMYLMSGGLPDPNREPWAYDGVLLRRMVAFFVDAFIVWGAALLIGLASLGVGLLIFGVVISFVDLFYRVGFLAADSATPGMRLVGIELRTRRGQRLDFLTALAHTVMFYVMVAFGLLQVISVIMMAFSQHGRGLHDALLGTTMLKRPE